MYYVYGNSSWYIHPLMSVIQRRSAIGRVRYRRFHCTTNNLIYCQDLEPNPAPSTTAQHYFSSIGNFGASIAAVATCLRQQLAPTLSPLPQLATAETMQKTPTGARRSKGRRPRRKRVRQRREPSPQRTSRDEEAAARKKSLGSDGASSFANTSTTGEDSGC